MTKTTCGDLWLSPGGSYSCTRFSGHSGRHGERFGERWKAVWSNVGERSAFPNEEHELVRENPSVHCELDECSCRGSSPPAPAQEWCVGKNPSNGTAASLSWYDPTPEEHAFENYKKRHKWRADMTTFLRGLSAVADCPLCGSWWMYNPGITCPKCRRPSVRRLRAETGPDPGLAGAGLAGAGAGASLGDRWQKVYTNIGYDEDI